MASDRLTSFPAAITAGTNLRIDLEFEEHLASAGGSLTIYFRGPEKIPTENFTLGTDGDAFTIDAAASVTTNWTPGIYQYTVKHTDSSDIAESAATGRIEILPDPANQSQIEARSFVEIMVKSLEALMKEIALNPYKQLMVGNKQYTSQNLPELEELISEYKAKLFEEQQGEANKQGNYKQYDVSFQFTD